MKNYLLISLLIAIFTIATSCQPQTDKWHLNYAKESVEISYKYNFSSNSTLDDCKEKAEKRYLNEISEDPEIEYICMTKCRNRAKGVDQSDCDEAVLARCFEGECTYFTDLEKAKGGFSRPPLTIQEKIRRPSHYGPLFQENKDSLDECDRTNLGPLDKVRKLSLYKSDDFSVSIYSTPTPPPSPEEECNELGALTQIPSVQGQNNTLWWNQLGCGFEVGEFFENETPESIACNEIAEEVMDYAWGN
jgi:hypothetical protein